jgi:hypothetical protein
LGKWTIYTFRFLHPFLADGFQCGRLGITDLLDYTADVLNRIYNSGIGFIDDCLKIGGNANLALVFALSFVFTKKKKVQINELNTTENQKPVDTKSERTIQWLTILFMIWFLFSLSQSLEFLQTVLGWSEISVVQPSEIYMVVIDFMPLILVLIALPLFIKRKRAGWSLLIFYNIYVLIGYLVYITRTAFFPLNEKLHVSGAIYFTQAMILVFLSFCVWLLTSAEVRTVFAVSKKSFMIILPGSIALTVGLLLLNQMIISLLPEYYS